MIVFVKKILALILVMMMLPIGNVVYGTQDYEFKEIDFIAIDEWSEKDILAEEERQLKEMLEAVMLERRVRSGANFRVVTYPAETQRTDRIRVGGPNHPGTRFASSIPHGSVIVNFNSGPSVNTSMSLSVGPVSFAINAGSIAAAGGTGQYSVGIPTDGLFYAVYASRLMRVTPRVIYEWVPHLGREVVASRGATAVYAGGANFSLQVIR